MKFWERFKEKTKAAYMRNATKAERAQNRALKRIYELEQEGVVFNPKFKQAVSASIPSYVSKNKLKYYTSNLFNLQNIQRRVHTTKFKYVTVTGHRKQITARPEKMREATFRKLVSELQRIHEAGYRLEGGNQTALSLLQSQIKALGRETNNSALMKLPKAKSPQELFYAINQRELFKSLNQVNKKTAGSIVTLLKNRASFNVAEEHYKAVMKAAAAKAASTMNISAAVYNSWLDTMAQSDVFSTLLNTITELGFYSEYVKVFSTAVERSGYTAAFDIQSKLAEKVNDKIVSKDSDAYDLILKAIEDLGQV